MKKSICISWAVMLTFLVGAVMFLSASVLQASPIIIQGDYIYTQISDDGTLGYGSVYPGIQYDPSGTATFGPKDFLQPGSPFEGFSVKSDETGVIYNNNDWGNMISGSLSDLSGSSPYDYYIRWVGSYSGYFDILIDLYLNSNDQSINFTTTIIAQTDLHNLRFARYIDPDQDVYGTYGTYDTYNYRGFGATIDENDWVYAVGPSSNWTIGLFSDTSITHNTGVSSGWSIDPDFYLAGNYDGHGDYTIGIAFGIDYLASGDSVTFDYSYVLGTSPNDAVGHIPTSAPVPEPSTMLLLGIGLIVVTGYSHKRFSKKGC